MSSSEEHARAVIDAEHLRLLSIFHFVSAGLAFAGVALSSLYFVMFQAMLSDPKVWTAAQQGPPPAEAWAVFRWFTGLVFVWLLVSAVGNLLSGFFLRARRHRAFSMVVAALNCLHIPFGTILGVFTFIVLDRPSVRAMYGAR